MEGAICVGVCGEKSDPVSNLIADEVRRDVGNCREHDRKGLKAHRGL